ncbi:MAG: hypothetical protein ACTSX2_07635 [Candidatus Thorarchaeota archaeon]
MEMDDNSIGFIIPLSFSLKPGKEMISRTNKDTTSPENARQFGDDLYYVMESEIEIGGIGTSAYLLLSKKGEADEAGASFNRLMDIEPRLDGKRVYDDPDDAVGRVIREFTRYFEHDVTITSSP